MQPQNLPGTDPRGIERTLATFELYIEELERGAADPADLERFARLLDRSVEPHCAREEALLLAAMAIGGVASGAEELSEARVRHHHAREVLATLRKAGREARALGHPRSVILRARDYVDLVRSYLSWHGQVVRPFLLRRLSSETLESPEDELSKHEQAELAALADELVEAYSERPTPVHHVP